MSILLSALRLHQPLPHWVEATISPSTSAGLRLPCDHRWPQVKPMAASRGGTPRLSYPAGLPGVGDEATWPAYEGHPNDPRAPDDPEHVGTAAALDDVIDALTAARNEVEREDDWTPRVAELVREAIESLQALEVEP